MIDITALRTTPHDEYAAYPDARIAQILTMAPARDVYAMLCECIEHEAAHLTHAGREWRFRAGKLAA